MDDKVRLEEEDRAARKVRKRGKPGDNDSDVGYLEILIFLQIGEDL